MKWKSHTRIQYGAFHNWSRMGGFRRTVGGETGYLDLGIAHTFTRRLLHSTQP